LRLITWNIRTGGGSRLPAIAAALRREAPDLVALQELRGFSAARLADFAASIGMTGHLAPSVFGQPVAVLVRPPLRILRAESVTWRLHHAAAAVTVDGPVTLVSTHLNPFSPERRRREATWLAAHFAARPHPVLLAGDLNGLSPHGDHAAVLAAMDERYRRRHLDRAGRPDTRGLAAFETGGLRDPFPALDPTVPTTAGGGAEFGRMRLDYILANAPAFPLVHAMRVLRGGDLEWASDHYPVAASIGGLDQ
jgi:exodeoxyribonuclease III